MFTSIHRCSSQKVASSSSAKLCMSLEPGATRSGHAIGASWIHIAIPHPLYQVPAQEGTNRVISRCALRPKIITISNFVQHIHHGGRNAVKIAGHQRSLNEDSGEIA